MAASGDNLRRIMRERLLNEMLSTVVDSSAGGGWKALIMDGFTTRVMSSALRMSDILETGVSVVEDLDKRREPLPLPAVYFVTPSTASVNRLLADFEGPGAPLYPSAHVFFSNRVHPEIVERIKRCKLLLPVLRTLKEVNLELLLEDGRTFTTGHPHALVRCMGERAEAARAEAEAELDGVASRLVTLFASLHELPAVRYAAGRPPEAGDAPGSAARAVLAQRLAQKVQERALAAQRAGVLPAREGCDLLVVDRAVDALAPVVHDWGYEALVYDLLPVEGRAIRYDAQQQQQQRGGGGGGAAAAAEAKEHLLDDASDDLWAEYRHAHVADVYAALSRRLAEFQERNRAARYAGAAGGAGGGGGAGGAGGALSTTGIRQLIQALPQFRDVLGRLAVHVHVSSELKGALNARRLTDLGELEQALVYGDKGSSELVKFLADQGGALRREDVVRLLAAYVATHPGKLDASRRATWQRVSGLDERDMAAVINLAFLGVQVARAPGAAAAAVGGLATLGFGALRAGSGKHQQQQQRGKKAGGPRRRRADGRAGGGEEYTLARYEPLVLDLLEDAAAGRLGQEEYPYVRPPSDDEVGPNDALRVASARTNKSSSTWARRGVGGGDGTPGASAGSGILGGALQGLGLGGGGTGATGGSMTSGGGGRRLVLFVIGGVTRGEMRAVHELCRRTGRDVLLGSTAVLTPEGFLSQLRSMGSAE